METRKKKSFKRLFAFLMAFVMVTSLAVSAVFAADPTFKDVPKDHDFYEEIEDLAEREIVSGYGDTGLFKPDENLTRAQASKMIALAAKYEASDDFETEFSDVPATLDLHEHIWALEEAEIVKGFGDTGEFRPGLPIKRGHVAKMVALAFELKKGNVPYSFSDLPKDDDEVKDAIEVLASNGIVSGYGSTGLFKPDELVTRGQFAKMISRALAAVEPVKVKTVQATTSQILKAVGQKLAFTVNGKVMSNADIEAAGYETKFESTITTGQSISDAGILDASALSAKKFEYRVVLTNIDDSTIKVVSDWKEVKVFDAAEIVSIAEVLIVQGDGTLTALDEVESVNVGDEGLYFLVTKVKRADGKIVPAGAGYEVVNAESSNTNVAYAIDDALFAVAKGTVTFALDIEAGLEEYEYSLKVVVKEIQVAKKAVLEDPSLKYLVDASPDPEPVVRVLIFDQNGDPMKAELNSPEVTVKKGTAAAVAVDSGKLTNEAGLLQIAHTFDAVGEYTFVVYHTPVGAAARVKLGEFKVQAILEGALQTVYTLALTPASATELDFWALDSLNSDEPKYGESVDIKVTGRKGGANVSLADLTEYSSSAVSGKDYYRIDPTTTGIGLSYVGGTQVLTVTLNTASKITSTKVEIVRPQGDKLPVVASFTINIVNTTPQVLAVTHISNTPYYASEPSINDIETEISDGNIHVTMSEGAYLDGMISDVTYVRANKQLKITVDLAYGGKTFTINNVTIPEAG